MDGDIPQIQAEQSRAEMLGQHGLNRQEADRIIRQHSSPPVRPSQAEALALATAAIAEIRVMCDETERILREAV